MRGTNTTSDVRESSSARVWQLAWPTIISNLLFTTVGFLHIKIAAGLGTSAVAAVTTGHRVFFLVQAILMGLSVATTATVSRHWGAKQIAQAEMASWTALLLALLVSAVAVFVPAVLSLWIALGVLSALLLLADMFLLLRTPVPTCTRRVPKALSLGEWHTLTLSLIHI